MRPLKPPLLLLLSSESAPLCLRVIVLASVLEKQNKRRMKRIKRANGVDAAMVKCDADDGERVVGSCRAVRK